MRFVLFASRRFAVGSSDLLDLRFRRDALEEALVRLADVKWVLQHIGSNPILVTAMVVCSNSCGTCPGSNHRGSGGCLN